MNYQIFTTVDITPTGVRTKQRDDPDWIFKKNQQRNYDTLIQVISLRAQPLDIEVGTFISAHNVFNFYTPTTPVKVWYMKFSTDLADVFGEDNIGLKIDLNGVPYIPALTETIPTSPSSFMPYGEFKNIDIEIH